MSSSAPGGPSPDRFSQPASGTPPQRPGASPPPAAQPLPPALLEKILRQTSERFAGDEPLAETERQMLLEVFHRHRGDVAAFEVVVVELVQAILRSQLAAAPGSSETVERAAVAVAQTLLADPTARPRLEELWRRLREVP